MSCKLLFSVATAAVALSASSVSAQYQNTAGSHIAVQTTNTHAIPPTAVANGVAVPAPPVVVNSGSPVGSPMVLYPTPAPPTPGGTLSVMTPQTTVAMQQTLVPPAPAPVSQTQVFTAQPQTYTPTYYWYYYQPPYQVQHYTAVPTPQPHWTPGPAIGGLNGNGYFGPMFNARGEAGHVRYPYYSYRRPWYYPGQPMFNANINGPVW